MIEPRDEELLNREIDGENTPGESAELQERADLVPEVRAARASLTGLIQTLARVEQVAPPAGLVGDVMRAIRGRAPIVPGRTSWFEALRGVIAGPATLRQGLTFASGLALGALVAILGARSLPLSRSDEGALSGTMLPGDRLAGGEIIERQRLQLDGVQGEATTRLSEGRLLAEIQLDSQRRVEVVISFEGGTLTPLALEQTGAGHDVALGPRELRLTHEGTGRYVLVLGVAGGAPSPLRLTLSGDGMRLEKTLKAGPGR